MYRAEVECNPIIASVFSTGAEITWHFCIFFWLFLANLAINFDADIITCYLHHWWANISDNFYIILPNFLNFAIRVISNRFGIYYL